MKMVAHSLVAVAAALILSALSPAASAQLVVRVPRDYDAARAARVQGRLLPLREIERRVVPTMAGAQYLGFDFDSATGIYTLKFLRDGNVIWVIVDGRSGQVLGRKGR